MFTCGGISIVIRINKNKAFLYLKSNLAKAYPARAEKITCPIVVIVATIRLLKKYSAIGISVKTFL